MVPIPYSDHSSILVDIQPRLGTGSPHCTNSTQQAMPESPRIVNRTFHAHLEFVADPPSLATVQAPKWPFWCTETSGMCVLHRCSDSALLTTSSPSPRIKPPLWLSLACLL